MRILGKDPDLKKWLIAARNLYDATYPNTPYPQDSTKKKKLKSQSKSKSKSSTSTKSNESSTKTVSPNRAQRVLLTEFRMSPPTLPNDTADVTGESDNREESDSDDGSEYDTGDTYLPLTAEYDDLHYYEDEELLVDGGYDAKDMEEDGEYEIGNLGDMSGSMKS